VSAQKHNLRKHENLKGEAEAAGLAQLGPEAEAEAKGIGGRQACPRGKRQELGLRQGGAPGKLLSGNHTPYKVDFFRWFCMK
jgi:hypothetical protein